MSVPLSSEAARLAWIAALAVGPRVDPAALAWRTLDGIAIDALHPAAVPAAGLFGRTSGRWRVASRIDHPDPAEANRLARLDVEGGVDTLVLVAADAPSARGFGIDWGDGERLAAILAGMDFSRVALRLDPGPACRDLPGTVARLADRGVSLNQLDLGIEDVAASLASRDGLLSSADRHGHADGARVLLAGGFAGRLRRADGRPWNEAGASEAQELAAVLASGVQALRALEMADVSLDDARCKLSFLLVADTDVVLTIAKFRALRRLWSRVEESCGLRPEPIILHAETSWWTTTASGPHSNILRAALATFAAATGGADGVTVLPFTSARGLPDAAARRLARNTQHVLAEEAHLGRVVDPVAGAGLFEAVTQDLCACAWALFQDIEREGGLLASVAAGRIQARVAAVRAERAARLNDGRAALVGTSLHRVEGEPPVVSLPMPAASVRPGATSSLPSTRAERLLHPVLTP